MAAKQHAQEPVQQATRKVSEIQGDSLPFVKPEVLQDVPFMIIGAVDAAYEGEPRIRFHMIVEPHDSYTEAYEATCMMGITPPRERIRDYFQNSETLGLPLGPCLLEKVQGNKGRSFWQFVDAPETSNTIPF